MPQSFTCLYHHLVFSTKGRAPSLDANLTPRLYEYVGGLLNRRNSPLVAVGGTADHVHLLVSLSKELCIAEALRLIKANSAKWIHETFPDQGGFAWQTGYGAFAVSASHLDRVKHYLASQAEHHRTRTFQEEFLALLQHHGLAYDERYLWQ